MYTHQQLPAKKKLLPRPCPQCKSVNGGVRFILFNPKFRTLNREYPVYPMLSISHYSPELRKSKERRLKNTAKIYHNFQVDNFFLNIGSEAYSSNDIFNHPDYEGEQSMTLKLSEYWFDYYKKYGWPHIITKGAHWMKGLKLCARCNEAVKPKELRIYDYSNDNQYYKRKYGEIYANIRRLLCKECCLKERDIAGLEIERSQKMRQQNRVLVNSPNQNKYKSTKSF